MFGKLACLINNNTARMPRDLCEALQKEVENLQNAKCAECAATGAVQFERCDCGAFYCTRCSGEEIAKCSYKAGTLACQASICFECRATCNACYKQICKHCYVLASWIECVSCKETTCDLCAHAVCGKCARALCIDCAENNVDDNGRTLCTRCTELEKKTKKQRKKRLGGSKDKTPVVWWKRRAQPPREPSYDILDEWHPSD